MYLVFPVIVIVIVLSAMFILLLWTELAGKHCQYNYDYEKKNKVQTRFMRHDHIIYLMTTCPRLKAENFFFAHECITICQFDGKPVLKVSRSRNKIVAP